ncbi:efflux RND transporter periplasmic adaptor subunit [Neiella marina]|uniref:Efflux RND transporter periplasmic adaptor subunit n=1 Tax=Neiella holothuriorum TaxID=2870530 RepID=A0ABS7EKI4_9GAMM|nr:efflux RND transporter periplasmic adaptor subunit [Neiella holothuriorum]MBW8192867.1 efflux RND transporter periplasmic adaptor subunit [Neiella holothuriorum]
MKRQAFCQFHSNFVDHCVAGDGCYWTIESMFMFSFLRDVLACTKPKIGLILFALVIAGQPLAAEEPTHQGHSHENSSAITPIYACPMHPKIIAEAPGSCPICGMDLVAKMPATQSNVTVAANMQQALGVRTQQAQNDTLWRYIETFGVVEFDETALSHLHARVSGWIENLAVHEVGQSVKQGDHLYDLYAPDLVNAQDDYLLALDYFDKEPQRGEDLLRKSQLRLELLGMSDAVIRALKETGKTMYRVPFYAPQDGIITELLLREGMYIEPGTTLVELVDLTNVWVIASIFENEQSWLAKGRKALVTAAAQGVLEQQGQVDYIYPELDPVTKALRARISLSNPDLALRPGAIVNVAIYGGPARNRLTIPVEALIQTERSNRVVVQRDAQTFSAVPVQVGIIAQGKAEILQGLQEGDEVVVSGQFLIDSEASLRGTLQRLPNDAASTTPHNAHQHH